MRNKFHLLALLPFLFLSLFCSTGVFAQKEETVLGGRNFGFSGIWGGTHHQITSFGNANSYIHGWHFGLEFGKSILVGLGGYHLVDDVKWDQIQNQNFEMNWRSLSLGYAFLPYKAVHPTLSVEGGAGRVELTNEGKDNIFVVQPTAGVEINVFRWFHIGLEGGYRFVTDSSLPSLDDASLSGAFGQASFKFGFSWGRYHKRAKSNYEDD